DAQDLGRRDRDLGGQLGTLAELQKRHLRAYRPIFGHVSSSLPHQPDRRDLRPFAATGFEKRAVPEWVDYLGLLLRWQRFGHVSGSEEQGLKVKQVTFYPSCGL